MAKGGSVEEDLEWGEFSNTRLRMAMLSMAREGEKDSDEWLPQKELSICAWLGRKGIKHSYGPVLADKSERTQRMYKDAIRRETHLDMYWEALPRRRVVCMLAVGHCHRRRRCSAFCGGSHQRLQPAPDRT